MNAIQLLEYVKTEKEARELLCAVKEQLGFLGGRVLGSSDITQVWRVQAFFESNNDFGGWLPDGLRHVVVPADLQSALFTGGY